MLINVNHCFPRVPINWSISVIFILSSCLKFFRYSVSVSNDISKLIDLIISILSLHLLLVFAISDLKIVKRSGQPKNTMINFFYNVVNFLVFNLNKGLKFGRYVLWC